VAQKEVVRGHEEEEHNAEEQKCKLIGNVWEVLGRRWALLMPGISSTVLAARLLEMEREGLISKKIYPEIPPKVEYRLTARARELGIILKDLGKWAQHWKSPRIPATTVE
jgi:DNA-binding HxlR family transcriptional regulator